MAIKIYLQNSSIALCPICKFCLFARVLLYMMLLFLLYHSWNCSCTFFFLTLDIVILGANAIRKIFSWISCIWFLTWIFNLFSTKYVPSAWALANARLGPGRVNVHSLTVMTNSYLVTLVYLAHTVSWLTDSIISWPNFPRRQILKYHFGGWVMTYIYHLTYSV